ncbi:hypothetical protein V6N13_008860 [Hibiscus sabdariffa]|uniref:Uncharacterized protein n=2 Tax=Hibiscus sabdariffa TaxID=183260 RepID=A0ABR2B0V5_9ROSI
MERWPRFLLSAQLSVHCQMPADTYGFPFTLALPFLVNYYCHWPLATGHCNPRRLIRLSATTASRFLSIPDAYPFSHLIVLLRQKKGSSAFSLAILHTVDLSHRRSLSGIACARQGRSNFIGEIK